MNAFSTKYKRGAPVRQTIKTKPVDGTVMTWFEPGTWLIDLVNFGAVWYVFFVEGNSRYLIALAGNAIEDKRYQTMYTATPRVPTDRLVEIFNQFLRMKRTSTYPNSAGLMTTATAARVKHIIGDSEKAFWSNAMMKIYNDNNITCTTVNVAKEGHRLLAVLDRVVRTIRDMEYRTHYDATKNVSTAAENINPTEMRRLVEVYNHTWHKTLSKLYGGKITPHDVHFNRWLEAKIIRTVRTTNYLKQQQPGFILEEGQRVLVKESNPDTFAKKRSPYINGIWVVTKRHGNMYDVQLDVDKDDEQYGASMVVPRSMLVIVQK